MKKIFPLLILLSMVSIKADSFGKTAFVFLGMPVDAESAAMGYTSVSSIDSPLAMGLNYAGIGFAGGAELGISHVEWIGGLRNEVLAATLSAGPGNLGIMASFMHSSFEEINAALPINVNALYTAPTISVGYAVPFRFSGHAISVGGGLLWARESLAGLATSVIAGGLGVQLKFKAGPLPTVLSTKNKLSQNLKFGVMINNLGPKLKSGTSTNSIPLSAALGVDYTPISYVRFAVETRLTRNRKTQIGFGIEGVPGYYVVPRIGYKVGGDHTRLTTGIGAHIPIGKSILIFDYALNPAAEAGMSHWITFQYKQNPARKKEDS